MSTTYDRSPAALIGTSLSSMATISASGSSSGTISIGTGSGNLSGVINVRVTIGSSAPGTNPTVQFQVTEDGTNFFNTVSYTVPITSTSTSYDYEYVVPKEYQGAGVTVTNGTTNSITSFASGSVLEVSN